MMWIMVTIHPKVSNSPIPKILGGERIVWELRERVMPAALRESVTVRETQPAGRDLAERVPEPHFLPTLQSIARAFPLAKRNQKLGRMGIH